MILFGLTAETLAETVLRLRQKPRLKRKPLHKLLRPLCKRLSRLLHQQLPKPVKKRCLKMSHCLNWRTSSLLRLRLLLRLSLHLWRPLYRG